MKIVSTIAEAKALKSGAKRVLVPTMGALHQAHGDLIRIARDRAGKGGEVAVTIFVNPLQFEPGSDYERYPRPSAEDEEFCRAAGVDILFRPGADEMYRPDRSVFVDEDKLSRMLEGRSRPGHFRGVCTVVAKLFHILSPSASIFGEKDFQQLTIIRRMVRDLDFNVEIIAVPTIRERDGLACSSRNGYLNPREREQATVLYRALVAAAERAKAGETSSKAVKDTARQILGEAGLARTDYVEVVDGENLESIDRIQTNAVLAAAVFFGQTRLIDNIRLGSTASEAPR